MKKNLVIVLMIISILSVSGCGIFSSDTDKMFTCMSNPLNKVDCSTDASREIVSAGFIDYLKKGDYDISIENTVIEGFVLKTDDTSLLSVKVDFDDLEVTASKIDSIISIVEDLYSDAKETGLEKLGVLIVFRQYNDYGYDSISVFKSSDIDDCGMNVYYHTENITLNTIIDEKEVIDTVLNNQEQYQISYTLAYEHDETDNKLSFKLDGDRKSNTIETSFYEYGEVDREFEFDDFFEKLFIEFPNIQFSVDD